MVEVVGFPLVTRFLDLIKLDTLYHLITICYFWWRSYRSPYLPYAANNWSSNSPSQFIHVHIPCVSASRNLFEHGHDASGLPEEGSILMLFAIHLECSRISNIFIFFLGYCCGIYLRHKGTVCANVGYT
ncbi:hypothetical protein SAY86_012801 [Trapa natans]|uniref:Uncharacterized protein n=1 Tax=Trapa natans TaxID=22666 RepID=A0AAN7R9J0_TRANT|nr:hypothetical protein SAY86_012801 [Trapa natans]